MIEFSDSARQAAHRLWQKEDRPQDRVLRLYLEGKGCDGFSYGLTFAEKLPDDVLQELQEGLFLSIDQDTYKFVQNCKVDWIDDQRGTGFSVENPDQKKFRGKFFRREGWKERLFGGENKSTTEIN